LNALAYSARKPVSVLNTVFKEVKKVIFSQFQKSKIVKATDLQKSFS